MSEKTTPVSYHKTIAIFGIVILVLQVLSTLGSWMRPILTYDHRMQTIEIAVDKESKEVVQLKIDNHRAYTQIQTEIRDMNGKLEHLCGQVEVLVGRSPPQRTIWSRNEN